MVIKLDARKFLHGRPQMLTRDVSAELLVRYGTVIVIMYCRTERRRRLSIMAGNQCSFFFVTASIMCAVTLLVGVFAQG